MLSLPFIYLPQAFNKIVARVNICTETKPGEYEGVCLNPKDIPPDVLDDVLLGKMIKEAGEFYRMELERRTAK